MKVKEAVASFKAMCEEIGYTLGNDSIADREAFNDYCDSLNKDGLLTDRQVNTMSNPF